MEICSTYDYEVPKYMHAKNMEVIKVAIDMLWVELPTLIVHMKGNIYLMK